MGALKSSRDEVRQSKLFRFSVSIWTIMTHFSQRSWSFFLRSARTFMFIGVEDTALLSPDRRFIRVLSRIHCRFGSASVALRNHSFAPAHSAFPWWSPLSAANPNDFGPLSIFTARLGAAPATPPRNLSLDFTQSVSWETLRRRLQTISIRGMLTPSRRSAKNAAGPRRLGRSLTLCADPPGH